MIRELPAHATPTPEALGAWRAVTDQYRSGAGLAEWAGANAKTLELPSGTQQRYVLDIPKDWSGNVVITPTEYANGLHADAILRALVVRQAFDPTAALYVQPNSSLAKPVWGFTNEDRRKLWAGNTGPVVDSIRRVTDDLMKEAGRVAFFGPSQAGVIAGAYGTHKDTPPAHLTLLETPNTQDRSKAALFLSLMRNSAKLKDNKEHNYQYGGSEALRAQVMRDLGSVAMAAFGVNIAAPDNLALTGILHRNTLARDITGALAKGNHIVHAWAENSTVSGDAPNTAIAARLAAAENYQAVRITGDHADHSVSNLHLVVGDLITRSSRQR